MNEGHFHPVQDGIMGFPWVVTPLCHTCRELRNSQGSLATSEWFSAHLHSWHLLGHFLLDNNRFQQGGYMKLTKKILAVRRVGVVLGQIVPELFYICVERSNRRRGNEAIHFHVPVHAIPDFPGIAAYVCATNLGANWRGSSVPAEPD